MTWEIDRSHSGVTFSAKHMMVTTVRGTMAIHDAAVDLDEQDPTRSSVTATIDAASIDTRSDPRDAHLRSPDFLDVERHPTIDFRSTSVERRGKGWSIAGELTIRGVARPIALEADYHGIGPNLQGGRRASFSARTRLDREAWGLTWNVALEQGGWLVSKEIAIDIDLVIVEPAAPGERAEGSPAGDREVAAVR